MSKSEDPYRERGMVQARRENRSNMAPELPVRKYQ
ncbi:hypothetical protein P378_08090 [Desulforamulus profundi]|uniref:Uncharacterized protein n=1 Tax=Desulforamulus profundi TaxID=1383067 RepID=A0A2C6MGA5_9FIRM|nr:hypothetical protein P378_08090 [Desulforamulus profundi]